MGSDQASPHIDTAYGFWPSPNLQNFGGAMTEEGAGGGAAGRGGVRAPAFGLEGVRVY